MRGEFMQHKNFAIREILQQQFLQDFILIIILVMMKLYKVYNYRDF